MKKAYVKPVFLAEEFVAAASVATCLYKPNTAVNPALDLQPWMTKNDKGKYPSICTNGDQGHNIMSGELSNDDLLNYARGDGNVGDGKVTLFDTSGTTCDFVWLQPSSGVDQIQVWGDGSSDPNLVADHNGRLLKNLFDWGGQIKNFMQFFANCNATDDKHGLDYETFNFNS